MQTIVVLSTDFEFHRIARDAKAVQLGEIEWEQATSGRK